MFNVTCIKHTLPTSEIIERTLTTAVRTFGLLVFYTCYYTVKWRGSYRSQHGALRPLRDKHPATELVKRNLFKVTPMRSPIQMLTAVNVAWEIYRTGFVDRSTTWAHMHTYIHTYRHTYIQTYMHTGIETYRHTDGQTFAFIE